ncbi:FAD binding domain-containing protein [Tunturiibacter lichenicola]|uniref:FAD binding domain-containing protein n=1 Tax=Tunturiibacter lichenicola TaxID=2051959 RepID=UPI0021B37608|nr:xanthine dehydrogenase family protein subunit M [Edaphobacter lichenicola]
MNAFSYERPVAPDKAIRSGSARGAKFLAGGTNLVDLMKYGVESPTTLVDINQLELAQVINTADGGVAIGALVRNSDLADHTLIKSQYSLLSQALLSGASPQLRNMATTGGNLLQRTRCYYFTDVTFPACNKRVPGSGCAAIKGYNRIHAILGQTDKGSTSGESCIATHPSDMCVAMAALDGKVEVEGPKGGRTIPFAEFHRLAGTTPWVETALRSDELIVGVTLPPSKFSKNAYYLKARDRNSYAFALISVAAGLEMDGDHIRSAGLALGGVALKPWRKVEAEKVMVGKPARAETFMLAADILLQGAKGYEHNTFKIELAKQGVVRALTLASQGTSEGVQA